jgi:IMP dehydrogenase/GMP reductase
MFENFMENKYKDLCNKNVVRYKAYRGMASRDARKNVLSYASVEGRSGLIEYSGTTDQYIKDIYLRLQASLSYGGALNWEEFREKVTAVKRSQSGIIAGKTHLDVLFNK